MTLQPTAISGLRDGALAGITVAITRPDERARPLADALSSAGARVIHAPTIEIAPPRSFAALDACIARLESYAWLVFTSVAAIDAIAGRLALYANGIAGAVPATVRIGVVGNTTASAAAAIFGRLDHIGGGNAERLANTLPLQRGDRVLFVCSDRARDVLPSILARRGALLDRVVGYCTVSVDATRYAELFQSTSIDFVIACSPSSAQVMGEVVTRDTIQLPPVICIGETTASSAVASGLRVVGVATDPSVEALVHATCRAALSPVRGIESAT